MRDKSRLKHVMVQAKISVEAADKLDNIVKEYKFNSRYEVMQYLAVCVHREGRLRNGI